MSFGWCYQPFSHGRLLLAFYWLGLKLGRSDGCIFTFVTLLTYGDLEPRQSLSRFLAILIGVLGTLLTGLITVAVRALQTAADG